MDLEIQELGLAFPGGSCGFGGVFLVVSRGIFVPLIVFFWGSRLNLGFQCRIWGFRSGLGVKI